jgi:hypothetical protein
MTNRPTAAFVLSVLGGLIDLLVSGVIIALGSHIARRTSTYAVVGSVFVTGYGIAGLVFSLVVIFSAVMLYVDPKRHVMWAILVLVFSFVSLFGSVGGLFVGLVLGAIGGALGIVWRPLARVLRMEAT